MSATGQTRGLSTRLGMLWVRVCAAGVEAVTFDDEPGGSLVPPEPITPPAVPREPAEAERSVSVLDQACAQLTEYLAGERQTFEVPLAPAGTAFQRRVWAALLEIPFGETTTYEAIARRLALTGSARAVGAANGRNPISIFIPCHRVIGASGRLTGYAGGLHRKRALLDLESRQLSLSMGP